MLMVILFILMKEPLKGIPWLCLFMPWPPYHLFVDYPTMLFMLGMQMMQALVELFHIGVCGGASFHHLDHLLATSLMPLRPGLLSKNST